MTAPRPDNHAELTATATALHSGDLSTRDAFVQLATSAGRAIAANLVDDQAAVDDVVQDAVVEALASLPRLRQPTAFRAWFALIVRRHAQRYRRRNRRAVPTMDLDDVVAELGSDPGAAVERSGEIAAVRRVLAAAAEPDRLLLSLRYLDEWSDEALGALLGISAGAVRKRLFDPRQRLRPRLAEDLGRPAPTQTKKEHRMNLDALFGTVIGPDVSLEPAPVLAQPAELQVLPSGFRVIDTLVPLPRGGLVELRGSGPLVFLSELIGNMAALGPAALVAVGARRPDANGVYARLHRLVQPEATAPLAIVVDAADAGEAQAVATGGCLAAHLAAGGSDVLLVVDAVVSDAAGPERVKAQVGLTPTGSVTAVRLAAVHRVGAQPDDVDGAGGRDITPPPWSVADVVVELSTQELLRGLTPPVDLVLSRSAVLDGQALPASHRDLARQARELLARAEALRQSLSQPLVVDDTWTGHSAEVVHVGPALRDLQAVLSTIV